MGPEQAQAAAQGFAFAEFCLGGATDAEGDAVVAAHWRLLAELRQDRSAGGTPHLL